MNSIWGSVGASQLHCLNVLQNKAIKIIKKLPMLTPTVNLYSENLLSLNKLYTYNTLLLIYKIKYGHVKCNIPLVQAQNVHSFHTRSRENYYLTRPRTELALKNVFYSGIVKFNALPNELKSELNITAFKRKIRSFVYRNNI